MHTLQLKDNSIFEKFMGLIEILPKNKISIVESVNDNTISFEEAKSKVQKALNDISQNKGLDIDEAFEKVS